MLPRSCLRQLWGNDGQDKALFCFAEVPNLRKSAISKEHAASATGSAHQKQKTAKYTRAYRVTLSCRCLIHRVRLNRWLRGRHLIHSLRQGRHGVPGMVRTNPSALVWLRLPPGSCCQLSTAPKRRPHPYIQNHQTPDYGWCSWSLDWLVEWLAETRSTIPSLTNVCECFGGIVTREIELKTKYDSRKTHCYSPKARCSASRTNNKESKQNGQQSRKRYSKT